MRDPMRSYRLAAIPGRNRGRGDRAEAGSRSADRYWQSGNLIDATRVLQLNVLVVR